MSAPSVSATQVKDKALEFGFHLVGIAPARRFPEADAYLAWLERGYYGDMRYLARNIEKRLDCRQLFPPVRSVIVCGLSYQNVSMSSSPPDARIAGKISRYACGADYHPLVKQRLRDLAAWLEFQVPGTLEYKLCVDTVPVLERLHGYYAGLGWIGKNGALIHPRYGSWFFLGELLVNLELEPDAPMPERCGSCRRCLDGCPTEALREPRVLDARRCLSYLTIELRGEIPEALRPLLGNTIFGCDLCQEVCPWNQRAEGHGEPAFAPRRELLDPTFEMLGALTPQDFTRLFKDSPLQRPKLAGLLRNVAIAIGNSGNPTLIPCARALMESPDARVRRHADWALQQLSKSTEDSG